MEETATILLSGRQPSSNVTIDLTTDEQVSTDLTSLTFTPENWNQSQTVNVSAIDDELVEGEHQGVISHSVSSEDAAFNDFALNNVTANILDNDGDGGLLQAILVLETFASGFNQPTAISSGLPTAIKFLSPSKMVVVEAS